MDYKEKVIALLNSQELSKEQKEKLENIFPELKESEDERIRKKLIENFKWFCGDYPETTKWGKDDNLLVKDIIAWLEKQSNKKQVEHLELKAGHWYICHRPYCCRADNLTVKEGEKFQCENDGVVKGFVIKEPEKYFMEINTPKDGLNDEVRRISTIQVLEYAKSLDVYNQYGKEDIDKNIAWLEKQGKRIGADEMTKPHWISVEDELPPKNEAYLAFWQHLGVTRYRFVKGGAKVSRTFSEHITHWMPLPQAPHHIIDANKKVDRVIGTADHIKTALDVLNKKGGEE